MRTFEGHTGNVYGLAVHPDGQKFVSACVDETACIWDMNSAVVDVHRSECE